MEEAVLYTSERTRVTRVPAPVGGGTAIRKQVHGPDAARIRHERAVLERLAGVAGVPRLLATDDPDALLLADSGGDCLAEELEDGPLDPDAVVRLTVDLARILAEVHRRGVVHRDITPTNVLRQPAGWVLIDFDLAWTAGCDVTDDGEVVGTLAYLAPEQTGRTGHPVDQRADLYGLGGTLYEALTGTPPFGTGDPLRLIHDHLARVPVAPAEANPAVPRMLSEIVMRLLAKEPNRRYQSADGLLFDLGRLGAPDFPLGERDFPLRLAPPARPVGRDAEIATLHTAFAAALDGSVGGVLIKGPPGVGKSCLIDQLRPVVAAQGGWFATGKFDQYRSDGLGDAVGQAIGELVRLLLAEPDADLAELRSRLRPGLGVNAGLAAALDPQLALLLDTPPEPPAGDPMVVQRRLRKAGVDLLRAIAAPGRPVVLVLDDLQWAGPGPMTLVDTLVTDSDLHGLLLVGAYRDAEVDAAHPLTGMLARWQRLGAMPRQIELTNLPTGDLGNLLAGMLRLPEDRAAELAEEIRPHTGGNPYDSVELVNALRRDGLLVPHGADWHWDSDTIRGRAGTIDVLTLLSTRIDELPEGTRDLLATLACLPGEVSVDVLTVAAGLPSDELLDGLRPAVDDGLVVRDPGADGAVRFRHDRVREAAYRQLATADRTARGLALARRLTQVPGLEAVAATQYLPVVVAVCEPGERQRVATLFRTAAEGLRMAEPTAAERMLSAALSLVAMQEASDLQIARHAVLYSLGRLDEADETYRLIEQGCAAPVRRADAASIQIASLVNRNRTAEAVALGREMLAHLGLPVPQADELGVGIGAGLAAAARWAAAGSADEDVDRPEIADPRLCAAARVIRSLQTASFHAGPALSAWLVLTALRLWAEHGPCADLAPSVGSIGFVAGAAGNYRLAYQIQRRVLAACEVRYHQVAPTVRSMFAAAGAPWFGDLAESVTQVRVAHEELLSAGDNHQAGFAKLALLGALVDHASTLAEVRAEADAALAFAERTGHLHVAMAAATYRQFARSMCGETRELACFTDESFDEKVHRDGLAGHAASAATFHGFRGLAAAIAGEEAGLADHAAAAVRLLPALPGLYVGVVIRLGRGLALAAQVRTADAAERDAPLEELTGVVAWFAERATDAPTNFGHLMRLIEAERAWAVGEPWTAAAAYDSALHDVQDRQRPWHRALISERAAVFHLTHGMAHVGKALLREAREAYRAWGATAKVRRLDELYPGIRAARAVTAADRAGSVDTGRSSNLSNTAIDLLGVLNASKALSSETSLDRLHSRVVEVLGAMTGATAVRLLLRDDTGTWYLPGAGGDRVRLDDPRAAGSVPLSVVRYVTRVQEPLTVADAARDDRFRRDPYLSAVDTCALLAVPVVTHGTVRALLLLENRLSRGAFTADRLGAVTLVAGQLAVSLDNAMVYASLERLVAERTEALAAANERLELLAVTDPLTGLANRRRLADLIDAEWSRALRSKSSLAVAMIDIDHFKRYNDSYGHAAGDQCLRQVARTMSRNVRDTDHVARYGGEEFTILLPETDLVHAAAVADRVRAAVATLAVPHTTTPAKIVTVSIGVAAAVPSPDDTADRLIHAADTHLYAAKRAGRNQVATEPEPAG